MTKIKSAQIQTPTSEEINRILTNAKDIILTLVGLSETEVALVKGKTAVYTNKEDVVNTEDSVIMEYIDPHTLYDISLPIASIDLSQAVHSPINAFVMFHFTAAGSTLSVKGAMAAHNATTFSEGVAVFQTTEREEYLLRVEYLSGTAFLILFHVAPQTASFSPGQVIKWMDTDNNIVDSASSNNPIAAQFEDGGTFDLSFSGFSDTPEPWWL